MMQAWLNQHIQAVNLVTTRLKQHVLGSFLICLAIAVTLTIPSLIYVVISNINALATNVKNDAQISVFLSKNTTTKANQALQHHIEQLPNIKSVKFVSKEDALKRLAQQSNNQEVISHLDTNPLPDAFFIEPQSLENKAVNKLKNDLLHIEGVQEVIVDNAWMQRLNSILHIGMRAAWILGILLSVAIVAVISNTIRMQIITHQQEIEVSELFGATKSFIRRPFLYMGSLYGFGGGLLSCLCLWIVLTLFNQSVIDIAQTYQSELTITYQAPALFFSILGISISIGWLAAYVAVTASNRNA